MDLDSADLVCRDCGRSLRRVAPDRWMHRKGGAVAACDLDSDHPPVPDLGGAELQCARCGERVALAHTGIAQHASPPSDGHAVEPVVADTT